MFARAKERKISYYFVWYLYNFIHAIHNNVQNYIKYRYRLCEWPYYICVRVLCFPRSTQKDKKSIQEFMNFILILFRRNLQLTLLKKKKTTTWIFTLYEHTRKKTFCRCHGNPGSVLAVAAAAPAAKKTFVSHGNNRERNKNTQRYYNEINKMSRITSKWHSISFALSLFRSLYTCSHTKSCSQWNQKNFLIKIFFSLNDFFSRHKRFCSLKPPPYTANCYPNSEEFELSVWVSMCVCVCVHLRLMMMWVEHIYASARKIPTLYFYLIHSFRAHWY